MDDAVESGAQQRCHCPQGGVAPTPPAYSTKVRWIAPKLVVAVNEKTPGRTCVPFTPWRPGL
ncbi:hypothetical protein Shyd_94040 [Streptomyces hydrogenans]|uniref:DNA ligase (ATP) n=1 Tax=Streptomyces hydrogenans TaxID=1873719 RepID=A0ABQ3PSN3_9ACTN|nr:hypothetical protein Shyd_94040 [Streptomyces hydrogenans]